MTRLIAATDKFDIAFANDTDADRMESRLPICGLMNRIIFHGRISYLSANRPDGGGNSAIARPWCRVG